MLYEIGHIQDGQLVRGGIKAPLLTVGKWIREYSAIDKVTVYVAVPASPEAITAEELYAELDKQFGRGEHETHTL